MEKLLFLESEVERLSTIGFKEFINRGIQDKRSASTFVAGGMADALGLSTLPMSKAEGLLCFLGFGLSGLGFCALIHPHQPLCQ